MTLSDAPLIVVMGVSGSGKSAVGSRLADRLAVTFLDADRLRPSRDARLRPGLPLSDADGRVWLGRVIRALLIAKDDGLVLSCSALTRSQRDALRSAVPATTFVHLDGPLSLLGSRLSRRSGYPMAPALLELQLAMLEPLADDERGLTVDFALGPHALATTISRELVRG